MNIDDIKKISLVEFLNQLGYQPTGRDSKGLWFYAPYRSERKPSFHVNPRKNVWFDFGSGDGGDIFTLAGELCDSTDFIRQAEYIAEKMQMPIAKPYKPEPFIEQPTFEDVKISKLVSPALLSYLVNRGIPADIAQRYCVQVDYKLHGKTIMPSALRTAHTAMNCETPSSKAVIRQSISPILPTATPGAMYSRASSTFFRQNASD